MRAVKHLRTAPAYVKRLRTVPTYSNTCPCHLILAVHTAVGSHALQAHVVPCMAPRACVRDAHAAQAAAHSLVGLPLINSGRIVGIAATWTCEVHVLSAVNNSSLQHLTVPALQCHTNEAIDQASFAFLKHCPLQ